jgi:apolipoprotein N-acyltransferase
VSRAFALGAAYALLFGLSFPFRWQSVRFDLGLVAGWLALVPLWLSIRDVTPGRAFLRAWGATAAGYVAVFWWLVITISVFGGAAGIVGVAGMLFVAAYCGLVAAALCALAVSLRPFAGRFAPLRGAASLWGVYGLSFALVLAAVCLAERRWLGAALLALTLHAVGWLALPGSLPPDPEPLKAALIQGNIPQGEKWDPTLAQRNFDTHVELSRAALAQHPDVILWPEAAVPGDPSLQPELGGPLLALANQANAPLLVGGLGFQPRGNRQYDVFNSVFAVTPERGIVDRYDKSVLVPFGEYVPAHSLLRFLSGVATALADMGDLTPGPEARPVRGVERLASHAPTALICYEVVYPNVVRHAVRGGAHLLLNLTNDAWYGRSSAPHQFLAIAELRSAEHGLPMLRAANTGVSAVIDASGRASEETELFVRRQLVVTAPPRRPSPTLYTRLGDWPLALSALGLLVCGGSAVVRRRRG